MDFMNHKFREDFDNFFKSSETWNLHFLVYENKL